jgi:RimJ/RimL family protein N-acetyltransferase
MLLTLLDGTTVCVRPIAPEDKPLLSAGLRRLSPETAFRRFLSPKVSFSQAELRYLTEVDGHDHIALVAVDAHDRDRLIAVARCVRVDADTADLAIVVGDPWQGMGLGRRLARLLAERAAHEGITRFAGTTLADNRPAFRLMRGVGGFEHDELSHGVRDLVVRLPRLGASRAA